MTTKKPAPVAVTRCESCGDEDTSFRPSKGECLRCGRPENQRFTRWIASPHPETTALAKAAY